MKYSQKKLIIMEENGEKKQIFILEQKNIKRVANFNEFMTLTKNTFLTS